MITEKVLSDWHRSQRLVDQLHLELDPGFRFGGAVSDQEAFFVSLIERFEVAGRVLRKMKEVIAGSQPFRICILLFMRNGQKVSLKGFLQD